jgi:hypothetical protein
MLGCLTSTGSDLKYVLSTGLLFSHCSQGQTGYRLPKVITIPYILQYHHRLLTNPGVSLVTPISARYLWDTSGSGQGGQTSHSPNQRRAG